MDQGSAGAESTLSSRRSRKPIASCCLGTGIKTYDGREWRCPCGLAPGRPLRVERYYEDLGSVPPGPGVKVKDRVNIGARSHPCGVEDCHEVTSAKKPFCAVHIDRLDHADWLKREIENRKREQAFVAEAGHQGWMKVDTGGLTAGDILAALRAQGPQDMGSLSKLVSVSPLAIRSYVAALKKAGFVSLKVSETNSVVAIAQG